MSTSTLGEAWSGFNFYEFNWYNVCMDIFSYWSRGKERLLLLILIALAVFLYAGFSFGLPWRFNSPDEAANAFFSQRVAQGQKLAAPAE